MIMSGKEFWDLRATHGLPLDFLVDELCGLRGIYPKWDEVLAAAAKDGANLKKLVASIKQFVIGLECEQHVSIGLDILLNKMESEK